MKKDKNPTRYVIDDGVIAKSPLSLGDVLAMLMVQNGIELVPTLKGLEERGYLVYYQGNYYLTPTSRDMLRDLLLMAEKTDDKGSAETLAKKLVETFPEGRKANTSLHWRCSVREASLRLREFRKMFGSYGDEEILGAARRYVEYFKRDRTHMRTLKFFIWKVEDVGGVPEYTSDLATWIENGAGGESPTGGPELPDMVTL